MENGIGMVMEMGMGVIERGRGMDRLISVGGEMLKKRQRRK